MAEFDAGAAVAKYLLDISQPRQAAQELSRLYARLRQEAAGLGRVPAGGGGGGGGRSGGGGAGAAARDLDRLRDSEIRAAKAAGDHARALKLIDGELSRAGAGTVRYNNLLAQQARVQSTTTAAARAQMDALRASIQPTTPILQQNALAADQFGQSLKSSFLGIAGPAALATAAVGGVVAVVRSFGDAFTFKAELDATNQSIANQLKGVRDSGRAFEEARRFGDKYRITQAETSQILQNSVGILRTSTTSVADLESTLIRLQSRNPAKPISEAARALRELNTGDVTTIKELFDVGAADALRMKNEIAGGADAVQVLSRFLTDAGNGMEVLEQRTRGAMGAINARAQAEERLQLAQARFAEGPGLRFLQLQTQFTDGLTTALTLNAAGFNEANRAMAAQGAAQVAYNAAISRGATEQQAQTAATEAYAAKARELEPAQNAVARAMAATGDAVNALTPVLQTLAEVHGAAGAGAGVQAAAEAQLASQLDGVRRQANGAGSALAAMRNIQAAEAKAEQGANASGIQSLAKGFGAGAGAGAAAQDEKVRQARFQQALALAKTDAQRIAILQKELSLTTDRVERIQLETQIAQLRNTTAKAHTSELNTQLGLEERIYDSQQKQYRAALDAQLASIDDRKKRILEADELRRAQNTAANARDPRIRALAQLTLERIPLEQQRRQLDIAGQNATAGGQVINGRVFQSLAGGGPAPAGGPTGGGPASAGQVPTAAAGAPAGGVLVQVFLDSDQIAARFAVQALDAFGRSQDGGGGQVRA